MKATVFVLAATVATTSAFSARAPNGAVKIMAQGMRVMQPVFGM